MPFSAPHPPPPQVTKTNSPFRDGVIAAAGAALLGKTTGPSPALGATTKPPSTMMLLTMR